MADNGWEKGFTYAIIFFILVMIIASFSSSPFEAGERFGKVLWPIIVIILGIYFGRKYFKEYYGDFIKK